MKRFGLAVLLLVLPRSTTALAQYCPANFIPHCDGPKCQCSPDIIGDPVQTGFGNSYFNTTDFTVHTSLGNVPFVRIFVSNERAWASSDFHLDGFITPFGRGPLASGVRWWNSFFSLAYGQYGGVISIADLEGRKYRFSVDAQPTTWAWGTPADPGQEGSLLVKPAGRFEFHHPNGTTLIFDKDADGPGFGVRHYFLSKARTATGATLFDVSYAQPTPSLGCPAAFNGIPYVSTVTVAPDSNGVGHQLLFTYAKPYSECVIDKIYLRAAGTTGPGELVAAYTYGCGSSGTTLWRSLDDS